MLRIVTGEIPRQPEMLLLLLLAARMLVTGVAEPAVSVAGYLLNKQNTPANMRHCQMCSNVGPAS